MVAGGPMGRPLLLGGRCLGALPPLSVPDNSPGIFMDKRCGICSLGPPVGASRGFRALGLVFGVLQRCILRRCMTSR